MVAGYPSFFPHISYPCPYQLPAKGEQVCQHLSPVILQVKPHLKTWNWGFHFQMRTLGLKVSQTVCGGAVATSGEEQEGAGCEVALAQHPAPNTE